MKAFLRLCLSLSLFLSFVSLCSAHESRPLYIELIQNSENVYQLQYKIPSSIPDFNLPEVTLAESFEALDILSLHTTRDGFLKKQSFKAVDIINGTSVNIRYPVMNPSVSTILRVELLSGEQYNQLLSPDQMEWIIPDKETRWGIAGQYTKLGIKHILEGWDHLLFLVCLVFIAGTGKKMLITITGFTIAHSITLILASLNVVNIPIPPVEAVIALSVVFLAMEIANDNKESLTYNYPIAVSSSFGLLHGFGFASVLSDIGLPQTQIPVSLLFFNVGVELGQIIFLLGVILCYYIYKNVNESFRFNKINVLRGLSFEKACAYFVGCIASYWMIERIWGFF